MLGVLLESRAGQQRRSAGATLSIVVHVAVIGAAVVGTAQGTTAPIAPVKVVTVRIAPPKPREIHRETKPRSTPDVSTLPSTNVVIRHIETPTIVPKDLPPIDLTHGSTADSIVIGGSGSDHVGSIADLYNGESANDNRDWDAREVLMHAVTRTPPRYPEALRSAGVDGRVLVQFMVDTTGRVDMAHVRILESTHELFTRAVRDALAGFRFVPAQVGGRRVTALAQMPFEFHITR
jgi:protein TonB